MPRTPKSPDENVIIGLMCSECDEHLQKTLAWLKTHDRFVCPKCGEANGLGKMKATVLVADLLNQIYR